MISKKEAREARIRCLENAVENINCYLSYFEANFRVSLDYLSETILVDDLLF